MRRQAREYATSVDWPRVVDTFASLLRGAGGEGRSIFDNATNLEHMAESGRI
jgi:hypothetical protein